MSITRSAPRSLLLVATVALVASCGGDDDPTDAASVASDVGAPEADDLPDDVAVSDAAVDETDGADAGENGDDENGDGGSGGDLLERAESGELGGGRATVSFDGRTFEYARVDGAMTICTELLGTFQVLLPLIDPATGDAIDGPELNLVVLQEGADLGSNTPDLYIDVGTVDAGDWFAGQSFFAGLAGLDAEPIEARADGLTFAATVPLTLSYDTATTHEAQIDVSCN